jgi:hypothetical protein
MSLREDLPVLEYVPLLILALYSCGVSLLALHPLQASAGCVGRLYQHVGKIWCWI